MAKQCPITEDQLMPQAADQLGFDLHFFKDIANLVSCLVIPNVLEIKISWGKSEAAWSRSEFPSQSH